MQATAGANTARALAPAAQNAALAAQIGSAVAAAIKASSQ
jgi:hypothetical protein